MLQQRCGRHKRVLRQMLRVGHSQLLQRMHDERAHAQLQGGGYQPDDADGNWGIPWGCSAPVHAHAVRSCSTQRHREGKRERQQRTHSARCGQNHLAVVCVSWVSAASSTNLEQGEEEGVRRRPGCRALQRRAPLTPPSSWKLGCNRSCASARATAAFYVSALLENSAQRPR